MRLINYFGLIYNQVLITIVRLKDPLESVIKPLTGVGVTCLDVGCGDRPYEYLFEKGKYVGIDIENSGRPLNLKKPDHFYNGTQIPFGDEEFDVVLYPSLRACS